jgi:hypothetical protein
MSEQLHKVMRLLGINPKEPARTASSHLRRGRHPEAIGTRIYLAVRDAGLGATPARHSGKSYRLQSNRITLAFFRCGQDSLGNLLTEGFRCRFVSWDFKSCQGTLEGAHDTGKLLGSQPAGAV